MTWQVTIVFSDFSLFHFDMLLCCSLDDLLQVSQKSSSCFTASDVYQSQVWRGKGGGGGGVHCEVMHQVLYTSSVLV